MIDSRATTRLADEYDATQEQGEVAAHGAARNFKVPNENVNIRPSKLALIAKRSSMAANFAMQSTSAWPAFGM